MNHKIGIIYSSYNNYDMFEGEVLKRVNFNSYPVLNIDDHSDPSEQEKGQKICADNGIEYQLNQKKGLQFAVDQGVRYLSQKYGCEWIFCLQQDVFPVDDNFFKSFESYIEGVSLDSVGAIGFNVLDDDNSFTFDSYQKFKRDGFAKGSLGIFFLSDSKKDYKRMNIIMYLIVKILKLFGTQKYKEKANNYSMSKRWFSEKMFYNFNRYVGLYNNLYSCELPIWAGVAINTNNWKKFIKPTDDFIFHLWFNDVAMQWLSSNIDIAIASDLYLLNDQGIKEKYGFNRCSATAGKLGNNKHVEKYGQHLVNFEKRWGFNYEFPRKTYKHVKSRYTGTLVDEYFNHDCRKGPLRNYK